MEFKLPDIGEGVHEGEIVRWAVKEGQAIAIDQPIVEIMTDKATVEIPSPFAGTVTKLGAKEGEMVKVGQTILVYEAGAGAKASAPTESLAVPQSARSSAPAPKIAVPAPSVQKAPPKPVAAPVHAASVASAPLQAQAPVVEPYVAEPGTTLATPATRRLARDLGVDLRRVPATGPHGRVTKEDVQRFSGASSAGMPMPAATGAGARPSAVAPAIVRDSAQRETLVPFRGIRRKIAEAMSQSRTVIPEFTYVDEVDVTELVAFRKEAKSLAEKQGVKLTFLPFITKALIRALKEFPTLNASLDETSGNVILKNYYNIGIAVDTEQGLVVPNVKDADRKSVLQIASEITDLAERARAGKLQLDEMRGGTITITNPGPIGGLFTAPVINWPEVAIVGIHKIVQRPIVREGKIEIADMMYISLAVDHRVVDGATAARFCNVVIEYLSNPKKLMLDMA